MDFPRLIVIVVRPIDGQSAWKELETCAESLRLRGDGCVVVSYEVGLGHDEDAPRLGDWRGESSPIAELVQLLGVVLVDGSSGDCD